MQGCRLTAVPVSHPRTGLYLFVFAKFKNKSSFFYAAERSKQERCYYPSKHWCSWGGNFSKRRHLENHVKMRQKLKSILNASAPENKGFFTFFRPQNLASNFVIFH